MIDDMHKIKLILVWIVKFPERLYTFFNNLDLNVHEAIADPKGFGMMNLLMRSLHVPGQYDYLFYDMPEDALCIDGGGNAGKFTDLVLFCGGRSVIFEPNPFLVKLMNRKYREESKVQVEGVAMGTKNENVMFNFGDFTDQSGSIYKNSTNAGTETSVQAVDFTRELKKLYKQNGKKIYLCKIDIEGAEFEVVEKMIEEDVCKLCDHIVVETHARYFADGKQKVKRLEALLKEKSITNVSLDWI